MHLLLFIYFTLMTTGKIEIPHSPHSSKFKMWEIYVFKPEVVGLVTIMSKINSEIFL